LRLSHRSPRGADVKTGRARGELQKHMEGGSREEEQFIRKEVKKGLIGGKKTGHKEQKGEERAQRGLIP